MFKKKIMSAKTTTTTSDAIEVNCPARGEISEGRAFAIQVVNVGTEAAGRTGTFTYTYCLDKTTNAFITPESPTILSDHAFDGAAGTTGGAPILGVPACDCIKITMTLSGALTNGADVYIKID